MKNLSFNRIISAAQWWKKEGGLMQVEVAALEPLLWSDGHLDICDVIAALKDIGFHVSMTTNGSLLEKFARTLSETQIDHVRISCHSVRADVFRNVTGGGRLARVLHGVEYALGCGIPLSMNRALMRGYTDDLEEHIRYIDTVSIKLKLLDMYWTKNSASEYDEFYISPEEALKAVSPEFIVQMDSDKGTHRRERTRYATPHGGIVEFKRKSTARKDASVCNSSILCERCIEGYGEYFRLFPDGTYSLCYLRTDLACSCFNGDVFMIDEKRAEDLRRCVTKIPLRLVLAGRCNFNCGFPGSKASWCLKQGRGFEFPIRH